VVEYQTDEISTWIWIRGYKMNEQIKALLLNERNMFVNGVTESNNKIYIHGSEENLEKFAELIVRECIDKIESHRIPVGNSAAGEMACEWTYAALIEIRDEIKEHFGVEDENIKAGAEIHAGDGGYEIGTQEAFDEFAKKRNEK